MSDFYTQLRKAELHLHLEGSVEPGTLLELNPTLSIDEIRERCSYTDFAGFIRSYVWVNRQLQTPAHYALVLRRLLERLHQQNVVHAEINLSVGVILWKQQDFFGIFRELTAVAADSPVDICWIFDAVRQFGAEPAREVAALAVECAPDGVAAFGIGGDEAGGPAGWFEQLFNFVRMEGLAVTPHAGETVGPDSVWACINMGASRIGHGIRSVEDPDLMALLRRHDIPLEVCITSNVRTGAVASLDEHPVRKLFDAGVPVTLNTDDPALFDTTLAGEYQLAAERFGFTEAELRRIAENGFKYSLGERKDTLHAGS